jgi:hypothetical protein
MTLAEKLAVLRPGGSWRVVYAADGSESVVWGNPAEAPSAAELLGVVKRRRQTYINERRDKMIAGGVTFNGWTFDTDPTSVNNLTAAVAFIQAAPGAGLQVPAAVSWRDATNVDRNLTPAQLVGLGAAIFTLVQTAHYTARQIKDAIEVATSEAAINAIDWP